MSLLDVSERRKIMRALESVWFAQWSPLLDLVTACFVFCGEEN